MSTDSSSRRSAHDLALNNATGQRPTVAIMLLGSTLWGLYWLPLRWLRLDGLPGLWAIAVVYCGATLGFLSVSRGLLGELRRHRLRIFGIGASSTIAGITFSLGMIHGEVARVMILFYLSPVWAVLLGRALLRERLMPNTVAALALAMLGAGVLLWPARGPLLSSFGAADILGLVAGLGFALTNVQLRAGSALPARLKNLSTCLFVPPVAAFLALAVEAPPTAPVSILLAGLLVGLVWMTAMTAATQYGISRLPLQRSSVLLLWELVVGAISAALLAHEALGVTELAGGLCIVSAGLAVARARSVPERAVAGRGRP